MVEEAQIRKLIITQNITMDGSIEMITDWFDPAGDQGVDLADLNAEMQRHDATCDAVLLGRQTFEDFRGYWPKVAPEDDASGAGAFLDQVRKYVVSGSLTDPKWANTTILSGDPSAEVHALKQTAGQDIVLTGSITLAHTLIAADLVDEYRLFTYPSVQGSGRRLFPDGFEQPRLRLLDAKSFVSGVSYTAYEPVDTPLR